MSSFKESIKIRVYDSRATAIKGIKIHVDIFNYSKKFVNLNNMSATREQVCEWADCRDGWSRTHESGVNN